MKYHWWSYTRIIIHGTGVGVWLQCCICHPFYTLSFHAEIGFWLFCFGDTLGGVRGLLLALCSGIIHGRAWGTICGITDWAQVVWVQDNYPKCYIIFLALILCFYRFLYHYFCLSSGSTKHISMDSFCLYRAIITSSEIFFQNKFIWFLVLETQPVVLKSHSWICT